ncbi:MAG: PQQ-binding-like beta-propeller repeat protein [Armatimonadota bacterium]
MKTKKELSEQLLDASSADKTSDIYAFGVVFYTALTGRTPIQGKSVGQVVRNILNQEPVRPSQLLSGVPLELEDLIMRCLAKPREERFQSFEELEPALLSVQEVVNAVHAERDDLRTCRGCGYVTTYSHRACPICANSFAQGALVEASVAPATDHASTPAPAEPELEPEMEAVLMLLQTARQWREKDDLQRAVNVLRQAMAIAPGHVEARRELDELILELARRKPKGPTKAYNWPMFRGNITRTGYTPEVLVPPLQRRWQYKVGDWVLASPVVANGVVYVGGRQNRPALQGHFVAVHADRGELIWQLDTPNEILLSPCVMGGNLLFVACHNRLMALDTRTGASVWDFIASSPITSSPAAWQNMVYFGTENGTFYALHAQSGQRIWTFSAETGIYSSALLWENSVYFGAGDHRLYAVDQSNGALQWEFMSANEITGAPLFHRGRIYVASTDYRLYSLDYATGRRVWEFATAGPITGSPAAWQDTIFVGSRDRNLYAVAADSGARKWHFTAGDWVDSSPAVSGRTVYFGSHDSKVYGVEAETGIVLWEYATDGEVASSPAVSGGRLVVGSNDGNLYCFRSAL